MQTTIPAETKEKRPRFNGWPVDQTAQDAGICSVHNSAASLMVHRLIQSSTYSKHLKSSQIDLVLYPLDIAAMPSWRCVVRSNEPHGFQGCHHIETAKRNLVRFLLPSFSFFLSYFSVVRLVIKDSTSVNLVERLCMMSRYLCLSP